jgi:Ni,Fe-hydrogenase III large subunit
MKRGAAVARYTARRDEFAACVDLAGQLIDKADGSLAITKLSADSSAVRGRLAPVRSGVGIVEGWRGTVVHHSELSPDDRITRAKIVDPSWFTWPALPAALAETIVPDFPLTNKSFNLSYAGNDL